MAVDNSRPADHPEIARSNAGSYIIGYFLTLALLGIALLMVQHHVLSAFILLA